MYVLETGFHVVEHVALGAGGAVAAAKKQMTITDWAEFLDRAARGDAVGHWQAKLWPKRGAKPVEVTGDEGDPFGLAIDPFDGTLVHGNPRYGVGWHSDIYAILEPNVGGPPRSFAFSPDGKRLILGCEWESFRGKKTPAQLHGFARKKFGKRWGIDQKPEATHAGDGFVFDHVAYLPDGERVAAIEWSKKKGGRGRGEVPTLTIHDAATLEMIGSQKLSGPVDVLLVCGERVLVEGSGVLKVWETPDLADKPKLVSLATSAVAAVAADPFGRFVLTAAKNAVYVWDPSNWTVASTYDWQVGPITCLAVSPDGTLAAAGSATGKVVVWDVG